MSPLARYALPALAAAGAAYAQSSCTASSTATVQNQGDMASITGCSTYKGSIAIQTGFPAVDFGGMKKLDGNLVASNNQQLNSISAEKLEVITGNFKLESIEQLNSLNFPALTEVDSIEWNALPNLDTLGFTKEVTKAKKVNIADTRLSSLKGINLQTVEEFVLASNAQIQDFSMEKLSNVTTRLELLNNNVNVNVSLPNLGSASNITFRNCSSIEMSSLERVEGSLGFISNPFTSFSAPNLSYVGGALVFVSNTELANLSLPILTEVKENLEIANNTKLSKINGLPKLKTVRGALDFNGNMTEVSLPALNDVGGAFNLQSTGDVQKTCDDVFKPLKSKGSIRGNYECKGKVINPGGEGTKPKVEGQGGQSAATPLSMSTSALVAALALSLFL